MYVYGYGGGKRVWDRGLIIKYLTKFMLCGWLIAFSTAFAQTEIEGEVSGEWNAEGSPYIVVDSTWVPAGEELRILEGVTVRFADQTGLYVHGIMSAIGTEEDSVHFTTNEEGEEWLGIYFYQPEEEYEFDYCTIRNAYNALVTRWHTYVRVTNSDINCTFIAFGTLDPNENDHVGSRYYFENSIIVGGRVTPLSRSSVIGINCYFSTGGYEDGGWGFTNNGSVALTDCDFVGSLSTTISGVYRNCIIFAPDSLGINVGITGGGALIQDCYVDGNVMVSNNGSDILRNEIVKRLTVQSFTGLICDNVAGGLSIRDSQGAITVTNCVFYERVSISRSSEVELSDCHILGNVDPGLLTLHLIGGTDQFSPACFIHNNLILGKMAVRGNYLDLEMTNNTIIVESIENPLMATYLQNGSIKITNNIMICEGENDGLYLHYNEPGADALINYNLIYGFDQFVFRNAFNDFDLDESNLFDVDPLLVSLDPLDPRPTRNSPCIDAGDPNSPHDPDGTRADIGMFYYHQELRVKPRLEVELPYTELMSVYPNPFNSTVRLNYSVPNSAQASINVYDITGKLVDQIVNGDHHSGQHSVTWDASNKPSGIYFALLTAENFTQSVKLMLMK